MNDAEAIAREAIASIDLGARVRAAVADIREPVVLAAVGKAAPAMARAAMEVLQVTRSVVVTNDGTDALGLAVLRAAHPIPDARSVAAAEALLELARDAPLLLALISGGASALACAPVQGVTLADKQRVVRTLLASGAPIADVNCVRRHLSRIKGGGLAALARRTRTLIASDVLFGVPSDVGSGPSVQAPSDLERARSTLMRYAPDLANLASRMTESRIVSGTVTVVAQPEDLAQAAAEIAQRRGYSVTVLEATMAPADDLATHYAGRALTPGTALVCVAEPSVVLPEVHGRGGRAGRVALGAWTRGLPSGVTLACIASDGVDGTSGSAGAVVGGVVDGRAALEAFEDGPFLRAHGAAVDLGPTGINLVDLHVLVCRSERPKT